MDITNILLLGIKESATRKQTTEARELFSDIIKSQKFNWKILSELTLVLYKNGLYDELDNREIRELSIENGIVYEYCETWITELLSPTNILSASKREKIKHAISPNGKKVYDPTLSTINDLTPKKAITYILDNLNETTERITKIIDEIKKEDCDYHEIN